MVYRLSTACWPWLGVFSRIVNLVYKFKGLRCLIYLLSPSLVAGADLGWEFFDCALMTHRSTLHSLTLDARKSNEPSRISHLFKEINWTASDHRLPVDYVPTRLGTLKNFEVLRRLQVHETIILPYPSEQDVSRDHLAQMLPVSLEELWITGCTHRMLPQIKTILDHVPSRFPHLVNIKLELEEFELDQETKSAIELEVTGMRSNFPAASIEWFETERFPHEIPNEG